MSLESATTEEIVQHMGFVRRVARGLVLDPHVAEDLSQSALLAALEQRPGPKESLRAWLVGAMRNLARVHRRQEARGRALDPSAKLKARAPEAIDPASPEQSAFETIERGETSEVLVRALMNLDEPYRTVLLARYLDEKSPPQIAVMLERPLETVQTQLRRGLQRLRAALDARYGGKREEWLAALAPLIGEKAMRAALQVSPATPALVLTRGLGVAAVLLCGVFLWRTAVERGGEPQSRAVVRRTNLEGSGGASVALSEGEGLGLREAAAFESTATLERAGPTAAPDRVAQVLRLVDGVSGMPVAGARLTAFDFQPRVASGAGEITKADEATAREVAGESVFDFSGHEWTTSTHSTGYSVRLGHSRTDLTGLATLQLYAGGATRLLIEADGFAPGYQEVVTVRSPEPLTIALERASGLELRRGDAPAGVELSYLLRNRVHEEEYRGVLLPGETRFVMSSLPPGLYEMQVRCGRERREGRHVRLEEGARTTTDLWRDAGSALTIEFSPGEKLPLEVESSLRVRSKVTSEIATQIEVMGNARFRGFTPGEVEIELRIGEAVVSRRSAVLRGPETMCTMRVPDQTLEVIYESDAEPSPYWKALLCGPLGLESDQRVLRELDLERAGDGTRAQFSYLARGDYELWVLEDFEAYRQVLTLDVPHSRATVTREPESAAHLEVVSQSASAKRTQFEVLTANGLHLPFPYLTTGASLVLPAGRYAILSGWPKSNLAPRWIEISRGSNSLELSSVEPARSVLLRAFEESGGAAIESLLIDRIPTSPIAASSVRRLRLHQGLVTLTMNEGAYFAEDAHGRRMTFVITGETNEIELFFR